MGKVTCETIVLVFVLHSLIHGHGASTAMGRKTLADLEIRRELKQLSKPAIKTIKSENGDVIDCIDIYKQPAFDHPLLKNHTIQMKPSIYDTESMQSSKPLKQLWHKRGSCPEGTIPIQRTQKRQLLEARSLAAATGKIESAKLSLEESNQGGQGFINAWNPHVEAPGERSSATIYVGRRDSFDLVSSGWMVAPSMYGDATTRFYAYWGTDNNVGCFNLQCPGFVQTNPELSLGGALEAVSTDGGEQAVISVKILRDQGNGNWWLVVQKTALGYWPSSLFKSMAKNADYIQWGGQIYNSVPGGKHTSTQMGSGLWPKSGPRKAAYFRDCLYFDESITGKKPDKGIRKVSKTNCYDIGDVFTSEGGGLAFYFGGPGGPGCDA